MLKVNITNDQHVYECTDWDTFERIATKRNSSLDEPASRRTVSVDRKSFNHFSTWSEAKDAFLKGWPEGLKEVCEMAQGFPIGNKTTRFEVDLSESGDEPSIEAYLEGDPENMITYVREDSSSPGMIYRIEFNPFQSGGATSDRIRERGAMVLGIYNHIIDMGGSCEVRVRLNVTNRSERGRLIVEVPVVSPDRPMSMERLAFILTNRDFYRRIMFGFMENLNEESYEQFVRGLYGYPTNDGNASVSGGTFSIPLIHAEHMEGWPRNREASNKIVNQLLEQGVFNTQAA